MYYPVLFGLLLATATTQASLLPLGATLVGPVNPGVVLKGPSTRAALLGPDGSSITAVADAGALAAAPVAAGAVTAAVSPGLVAAPVWGAPIWGGHGVLGAGCLGLGCW